MTVSGQPESFILTRDLGQRVAGLHHVGLAVPHPDDLLMTSMTNRLVADLTAGLAPCQVISIGMGELSTQIVTAVDALLPSADTLMVSTCPEIATGERSVRLEVNRVYSLGGDKLGPGPRPGHPPLPAQLHQIAVLARGRRVVLVEDGIFSGATVRTTVDHMRAHGIAVELVVVGFAFDDSRPEVERLERDGIHVITVHQFGRLRDWVPDHDFFPFLPGCGRVVGVNPMSSSAAAEHLQPLYTHNQATYAFPYLLPFTRTAAEWAHWTGIDEAMAVGFAHNRLRDTVALFEHLEALNGRIIRLADIVSARPRVNVPVTVGQRLLPGLDVRVLDALGHLIDGLTTDVDRPAVQV